jgi:hypothetical protein
VVSLFADYHHADLFEAHQLMFGDRLGYEVYAPWGMEWYDRWYWSFEREWHGDAVARQYLIGVWRGAQPDANGIVRLPDPKHPGRELRGISLDAALARGWDLVLSSVPANAVGFQKLAQETGAHWGVHIGNQWGDEAWERRPEFAVVTTTSAIPGGVPHVVVHQEFSLQHFRYEAPSSFGPIRSFVNCFPETPEYTETFLPVARAHPEVPFEVYGACGTGQPDEFTARGWDIEGVDKVGDAMRGAGAIWHAKHWSDGFGHVIHNAFAVGRPVIGYQRYYADKLAGPLWVDGVTSFDVERYGSGIFQIIDRMRNDADWYLGLCANAAAQFRHVVDFAADAEQLRLLIEAL